MAKPVEPVSFDEAIESMTGSILECRELGHTWKPLRAAFSKKAKTYARTLRCPRCHTEREQELSARGTVISNHYVYPDGYLIKGLGAMVGDNRDKLRLASLTRTINRPATNRLRSVS